MSRHPNQPEDTDKEEDFLARWSRRKARSESAQPEPEAEPTEPDGDRPETQEPIKRDEDMPPLESIDDSSDVSEFFSPGVSETLRKAALRKLFHSPAFNIVDGLDDYDDDFTTFKALGDLITADMRHQMELEKERKRAREMENTDYGAQKKDNGVEEAETSPANDEESESVVDSLDDRKDDQAQSNLSAAEQNENEYDEEDLSS